MALDDFTTNKMKTSNLLNSQQESINHQTTEIYPESRQEGIPVDQDISNNSMTVPMVESDLPQMKSEVVHWIPEDLDQLDLKKKRPSGAQMRKAAKARAKAAGEIIFPRHHRRQTEAEWNRIMETADGGEKSLSSIIVVPIIKADLPQEKSEGLQDHPQNLKAEGMNKENPFSTIIVIPVMEAADLPKEKSEGLEDDSQDSKAGGISNSEAVSPPAVLEPFQPEEQLQLKKKKPSGAQLRKAARARAIAAGEPIFPRVRHLKQKTNGGWYKKVEILGSMEEHPSPLNSPTPFQEKKVWGGSMKNRPITPSYYSKTYYSNRRMGVEPSNSPEQLVPSTSSVVEPTSTMRDQRGKDQS